MGDLRNHVAQSDRSYARSIRWGISYINVAHSAKYHYMPRCIVVTMKLSLAFLIALALSGSVNINASPVRSSNELHDVLDEFLALVPQEQIVQIFFEYLNNDAEVQAVMEYMTSDAFRELVKKVESIDDVINFYDYLNESGLDIYNLVNKLHELIGLPPLIPDKLSVRNIRISGGVAGLIADIKAILPIDDIKALYYEKLEISEAFAELVERLSSRRFQELINALRANEEFRVIVRFCEEIGIDIRAIKDLLTTIFGLEFPEQRSSLKGDLNDDLQDFLTLLPIEIITEIAMDYLENDQQLQEAIDYLQSPAFHQVVQEVEEMKEARDVLAFLQESGLDAYGFLNTLHDLLGIPTFHPSVLGKSRVSRAAGGISGLIADIMAILPVEDIKALYYEKLENSPAFSRLIERLGSPEFQEFVDAVLVKEEVRVIINKLKAHGVDLEAITDLLSAILGLKFPKPNASARAAAHTDLNDDLQDFLALLPIGMITEIAMDYLENDQQLQEAIDYLQSPAFHQVVQEVEEMKEARDVLAFLQESGLDAYGFLNTLHDLLGIPTFHPSVLGKSRVSRAAGGISGLIADIMAILPVEDIKALYYEKLENSPAFSRLIERLGSPEFQEFVDAVLVKEEVRVIIGKLKAHGVDLEAITDLLSAILGLKFPEPAIARSSDELVRDLADFVDLLPLEDIIDVSVEYVLNDRELQQATKYIQSQEFKTLATNAQQNNEFRTFVSYLEDSGLPAFKFINDINRILSIPKVSPQKMVARTGNGVRGMLDAIEALLPRPAIKQMYDDKMKTSKVFVYFIHRLTAQEFQAIVDELVLNEDFQKLGYRAADFGIDLQAIVDFVWRVFGIEISGEPSPLRSEGSKLNDDLQEFVNLLPNKKIRKIVVKHYIWDKEFRHAIAYVRSEEFHKLVRKLHEIPEYNDMLKSLEEIGLDVQSYIEQIHKAIDFKKSLSAYTENDRSIASFINEVKATLPINDIKALYQKKLETSEDFVQLVKLISSQQFQAITNALFADDTFKDILHRLQGHGVNMQAVADFFLSVFGIETPPGIID